MGYWRKSSPTASLEIAESRCAHFYVFLPFFSFDFLVSLSFLDILNLPELSPLTFFLLQVLLGRGSERFLALASRADPLGWAALEVACSRNRNHTGRSRAKVHHEGLQILFFFPAKCAHFPA